MPADYLKAGDMIYRDRPARIITVLGSCIAVTMFDEQRETGAICHALMPECQEPSGCRTDCQDPLRYVDCAVSLMAAKILRSKTPPARIQVKVFGGADMFGGDNPPTRYATVGSLNAASALRRIGELGMRVSAKDVGGYHGRKIYFYPHTGEVWLKRLGKS